MSHVVVSAYSAADFVGKSRGLHTSDTWGEPFSRLFRV